MVAKDLDQSGNITKTITARGPTFGGISNPTAQVNAWDFGADPYGLQDSAPAINKCLTFGLDVILPPGTYLIKSTITMGNGSSGVASTLSPARLIGQTSGSSPLYTTNPSSGATLVWGGAAAGTMMQINGPLQGWGVENIAFNGNAAAAICLDVTSAQFGSTKNLSFSSWTSIAWRNTCWSSRPAGWIQVDTLHNIHVGTIFNLPSVINATALFLTGNAAILDNTSYCTWIDVFYINPSPGFAITDLYLQFCDACNFIGVHHTGGDTFTKCIVFDYSFDPAHQFPTSNFFFSLDASGSLAPPNRFSNVGSPASTFPNMIFGLNESNGVTDANATIANLSWIGTQSLSVGAIALGSAFSIWSPTYTSGGGTLGTTTTNAARFQQMGKLVQFFLDVSITSAGTSPTGLFQFTLPVTPRGALFVGAVSGWEQTNNVTFTGFVLGNGFGNAGRVGRYDGNSTAPCANGNRILVSGMYEAL
jgi:hypothetical protein